MGLSFMRLLVAQGLRGGSCRRLQGVLSSGQGRNNGLLPDLLGAFLHSNFKRKLLPTIKLVHPSASTGCFLKGLSDHEDSKCIEIPDPRIGWAIPGRQFHRRPVHQGDVDGDPLLRGDAQRSRTELDPPGHQVPDLVRQGFLQGSGCFRRLVRLWRPCCFRSDPVLFHLRLDRGAGPVSHGRAGSLLG